jgi:hypothetical protein
MPLTRRDMRFSFPPFVPHENFPGRRIGGHLVNGLIRSSRVTRE